MVKVSFDSASLPHPAPWASMTQKLAVPALKVETLKQRMRGNLALFGGNYLIVGAVFLTLILWVNAGLFSSLSLLVLTASAPLVSEVAAEDKWKFYAGLGLLALGSVYSAYECVTKASVVFLTLVVLAVVAHALLASAGDSVSVPARPTASRSSASSSSSRKGSDANGAASSKKDE